MKKETTEKLDVFRRQQEEADKALLAQEVNLNDRSPSNKAGNLPSDEAQWTITGRKRKRAKEKEVLKGVKLRKSSTSDSAVLDAESREISPILTKGETTSVQSHTKPGEAAATQKAELHIHGIHENSTKSLSTIENGTKSGLGLAGYSSDDED